MTWKERIAKMVLIKQRLDDVDKRGIWEYRLPEVKPTDSVVLAAERALGESLPPELREYYSCAGGWPRFYLSADLCGPRDLHAGDIFERGLELCRGIEEDVLKSQDAEIDDVYAISVAEFDVDLFLMFKEHHRKRGSVVWIAGDVVDVFPTFVDYFEAMMDYNRDAVARAST